MTEPVPFDKQMTIVLQAQQWNQVLELLDTVPAPHRMTDPLIRTIMGQLQFQQQQEEGTQTKITPQHQQGLNLVS